MYKPNSKYNLEKWIISSRRSMIQPVFKELWIYRFLLVQLIRKDFQLFYRQTMLGPLWFFIQPALSTLVFTFAFAGVAGISTDQLPAPLFYLAGLTIWNYLLECVNKTCTILRDHAPTFGKIYFPRLIVPVGIVTVNLIRFGIQLLLFLVVYVFYLISGIQVRPTWMLAGVPFLILLMAMLGLGIGLIVSSLTVKYRDLAFLISFGIQLMLFVTPVIYPLSAVPSNLKWVVQINPITTIMEAFRYAFLGTGVFGIQPLAYSSMVIAVIFSVGLILYNKVEKNFIDII